MKESPESEIMRSAPFQVHEMARQEDLSIQGTNQQSTGNMFQKQNSNLNTYLSYKMDLCSGQCILTSAQGPKASLQVFVYREQIAAVS